MHSLGYKTVLGKHALDSGPLYYAGTIEGRLEDIHAAFADPAIDGIICVRGGWGSAELLPRLDARLIRSNPKVFIGYSDHTSLHVWLRNEVNLVTFYGPMVGADFSRDDGVDGASWRHSLEGDSAWSVGVEEGLRVLRPGRAEGLRDGAVSLFTRRRWARLRLRALIARAFFFLKISARNPINGIGCSFICATPDCWTR